MSWKQAHRLLVPAWLFIGSTMTGCIDPNIPVCCGPNPGSGAGSGTTRPPPSRPTGAPYYYEFNVVVKPRLSIRLGQAFGAIRSGAYVDSLRVRPGSDTTTMRLYGRVGRPGTYRVTVAAWGYITWDTTGVVVYAPGDPRGRPVLLNVELESAPR